MSSRGAVHFILCFYFGYVHLWLVYLVSLFFSGLHVLRMDGKCHLGIPRFGSSAVGHELFIVLSESEIGFNSVASKRN